MKSTTAVRLASLSLAFLASAALTGCGIGVSAPAGGGLMTSEATLKGNVHGGQQPVIHSVVNLYSAGTTGYGSTATKLATYTSNDIDGSFSFTKLGTPGTSSGASSTWQCPDPATAGDPMIYMTATGGNPNGGTDHTINNPAIAMVTVLGPCSTVNGNAFLSINEITTTAAAITFGPYFNPNTESIGTNGVNLSVSGVVPQGTVGLNNAFATFLNLVNPADGTLIPSFNRTGTGTAAGVTLTGTNESDKLTTFANILSACINSGNVDGSSPVASAQCTQMFASAVPPALPAATSVAPTSFNTATDTLMSAIYMAINPADTSTAAFVASSCGTATSHLQCLYNLQTAFPAFGGGLSAVPTDWTVGINYTASGNCTNGKAFLLGPGASAIDAAGNFWFVNGTGTSGAANFGEISPNGTPLVCAGAGTTGRGITIDPSGNVWAIFNSNSTNGIKEWNATTNSYIPWATPDTPWGGVSDMNGNIFFEATTTGGVLYEFIAPGNATAAFPAVKIVNQVDANTNSAFAYSTATDSLGRVYFPPTDSSNYQIYASTPATSVAITGYSVSGGVVTFNTATNTFATGNSINITGLTTGTAFNHQILTLTGATSNTITAATTQPDTTQTTDSGSASTLAAYTSFKFAGTLTHYGTAVDSSNNVFSAFTTSDAFVRKYAANANGVAAVATTSANYIGGVNGSRAMTLDGAANIWVNSDDPQTGTQAAPGLQGAVEIATVGGVFTAISPTGATAPSSCAAAGCATNGGYQKAALTSGYSVSVDISGNVWYPGSNLPGAFTTGFAGTNILEILGAAVPTTAPFSVAAKNGTLATRP